MAYLEFHHNEKSKYIEFFILQFNDNKNYLHIWSFRSNTEYL